MRKIKFEYRITLAYLLIGSIWIVFSDNLLNLIVEDINILTQLQTYKGWFYVAITAILFFLFLKKHLNTLRYAELELDNHRKNLQRLVDEKTSKLDSTIEELRTINEELHLKNDIINNQNIELNETVQHLKETQLQLIHADKMASLGVLTAGVAHEINNPLNFIAGGLTGLENHFMKEENTNDKIVLFLNSIRTGVARTNSIVQGLNQLSRSNDTYEENCDIHSIIDNCLSIINSQLKGRIDVFKLYADKELKALGNVGKLHQVFLNILINANQSIAHQGTISIVTEEEQGSILIKVSDTGCGISKVNLSRVTEPFFTTKEPGKGTGLGLSIAYSIIQAHKGRISIQSEENKWTTVEISLPAITITNA